MSARTALNDRFPEPSASGLGQLESYPIDREQSAWNRRFRPIPASDGAGMTAPKRTFTSCHSRGRSLSWGRAEHPARRAEQQEAGRKARLPLLRSQVPVLFQIKFLARPRTHYSPDLAAVDRTLVGGCQAAFHLLQYLICLGSRTVQRRPVLVVDH